MPSFPEAVPQAHKAVRCMHWERLGRRASNGNMITVIAFHLIDGLLNHVQELQAKLHSISCRPAALNRRQSSYVINRSPRTLVEELPCGQDRKKREYVLIFEAMQLVCAAAEQYQIWERLIGDKRLNDDSGRAGIERSRIPVNQPRDQRAPRIRELFGESMGKLHGSALVCCINAIPFPPLQFLRFVALGLNGPFSGLLLVSRTTERDPDGCKRDDSGGPPPKSGEGGPVEIARRAPIKARSQVLEFGQLQFPLWNGRHSPTGMSRGAFRHG